MIFSEIKYENETRHGPTRSGPKSPSQIFFIYWGYYCLSRLELLSLYKVTNFIFGYQHSLNSGCSLLLAPIVRVGHRDPIASAELVEMTLSLPIGAPPFRRHSSSLVSIHPATPFSIRPPPFHLLPLPQSTSFVPTPSASVMSIGGCLQSELRPTNSGILLPADSPSLSYNITNPAPILYAPPTRVYWRLIAIRPSSSDRMHSTGFSKKLASMRVSLGKPRIPSLLD